MNGNNFEDTGEYELGCDNPDVYFVMVPEPSTASLLAVLAIAAAAVFRMRKTG